MPLTPAPESTTSSLVRALLGGDLSAVGPLTDRLKEVDRHADAARLCELVSTFAVATFLRRTGTGFEVTESNTAGYAATARREFIPALYTLFWLDLYTLDSTLGTLDSIPKPSAVFLLRLDSRGTSDCGVVDVGPH